MSVHTNSNPSFTPGPGIYADASPGFSSAAYHSSTSSHERHFSSRAGIFLYCSTAFQPKFATFYSLVKLIAQIIILSSSLYFLPSVSPSNLASTISLHCLASRTLSPSHRSAVQSIISHANSSIPSLTL